MTSSSTHSTATSWASDEPPKLELDHDKLKDFATNALGLECTQVTRLTQGSYHEIFVLSFSKPEDNTTHVFPSLVRSDFTCIARFTREKSYDGKDASEIATIQYLAERTDLPLPEIYAINLTPDNDIGAPITLMERLPGKQLSSIWQSLSLDHKKAAVSQISRMLVKLVSVKFDKIGSLTPEGVIGPLISACTSEGGGPFDSNLDYMHHFVNPESTSFPGLADTYRSAREALDRFMDGHGHTMFEGSFVMRHADFDGQNIMFTLPEDGSPPKLTGLIDFEYSHSSPLYWAYEYPMFIQDDDFYPEEYEDNAILRAHFVSEVFRHLPNSDTRAVFIDCMNAKSYTLNRFRDLFMGVGFTEGIQVEGGKTYVKLAATGSGDAYDGREGYEPEYYGHDGRPVKHIEGPLVGWISRRAPAQVTIMLRWCQDAVSSLSQRVTRSLAASCPRRLRVFILGDEEAAK
ncbi:kinase-like domain-containing protein [Plectosphaerella cucumerina]|uniref:Kinase-like domain-containing protein n=1 Tax=Plectosphaerella cucumerina TaxID=40658 RepID=A0A8K0T1C1_9PEZI|nr:kinase-like domain-containing protein [Plectosphaerella cucumerina]